MSFTGMHLLKRRFDAAHCGWSAGYHWRGDGGTEVRLSSYVWSFIAFREAGEPTRGGSSGLTKILAILTDRTNLLTRDIYYLAWRNIATPKSGRSTTRRRHVECGQASVVAELILTRSSRNLGEIEIGRLREE